MFRMPILFIAWTCATTVFGQADSTDYARQKPKEEPAFPFKERLWFGGGIGLSFGTVTAIQLDPLLGVHLDRERKASAGLGLSYTYFRDARYTPPYELSAYGYRLFSRYRIFEPVFLHVEFLHLNVEPYYYFLENRGRIWVPHLLVGGGYMQSMGGNSSFYIQVLFEVLQDPNSFYVGQGPILSGGIGLGF